MHATDIATCRGSALASASDSSVLAPRPRATYRMNCGRHNQWRVIQSSNHLHCFATSLFSYTGRPTYIYKITLYRWIIIIMSLFVSNENQLYRSFDTWKSRIQEKVGQWGRFCRLPWVLDAPTHHESLNYSFLFFHIFLYFQSSMWCLDDVGLGRLMPSRNTTAVSAVWYVKSFIEWCFISWPSSWGVALFRFYSSLFLFF